MALLVVLWSGSILAQSEYRFERLSLEHGLSQSSVFALAQDHEGFIWIATEQGADRFDGYSIETLRHDGESSQSLSHSAIRAMYADEDGSLWIGTRKGLDQVDLQTGQVRQFLLNARRLEAPFTIQSDGIGRICTNDLLVLTRHGPWLMELETKSLRELSPFDRDQDDHPTSWLADGSKGAWLASDRSLWRLSCDSHQVERLARVDVEHASSRLSGTHLLARLADRRWLWASRAGLKVVENGSGAITLVNTPEAFDGQRPLAAHTDSEGRTWLMLQSALVIVRSDHPDRWIEKAAFAEPLPESARPHLDGARSGDGRTWLAGNFGLGVVESLDSELRLLEHDPSQPSSLPPTLDRRGYRILADRFGVLWVGATLGGMARYVPEQHRFERVPVGVETNRRVVRGVVETNDGDRSWLWVGFEDTGLEVYELTPSGNHSPVATFRAQDEASGVPPGDRVFAMVRQPESNQVWILGESWLARHSPDPYQGEFVQVEENPGLSSPRSMSFSRDGQYLFVTTAHGLWKVFTMTDPMRLEPVEMDSPPGRQSDLYPIIEMSDGRLMFGSRQGLHRVEPETGRHSVYSLGIEQPGSPARFVFSLAEATNGDLWVGTHGGGLVRIAAEHLHLDDPPSQRWTTDQGLADNTVYAILEDEQGCVWISGNRGLSQLCPETERIRNFGLQEGLQAYEFNGRVADIGPSGRFYFGGIDGLNVFRPERIQVHTDPPLIHLKGIEIAGQPLDLSTKQNSISLAHDENDLVIEYLGLHTVAPEQVRYAHRLLGLETEWVDAENIRRVRYPALTPGDYRFELRAANPDGVWSEPRVLFEATIRQPPWQTRSAYFAYLLILFIGMGLLAWSVRRRRRQLQTMVDLRTRALAERNRLISQQASELEKLLESRQTLYANVSHELRTPLTLIRAGLGRIKDNPTDIAAVEMGERYVKRLDRLIDQLLDLSRVRDHAFLLAEQSWSLNQRLRQLAQDHSTLAEERNLHLGFVAEGQWQTRCNPELVDKCLNNLLSNALKYTPQGGQIMLRLTGTAESASIEISDTGPGIEPAEQATIFERFQRLPVHENHAEKGAGIGLALVREAAEALGGEIRLESQPGQGSRFILSLPAQPVISLSD